MKQGKKCWPLAIMAVFLLAGCADNEVAHPVEMPFWTQQGEELEDIQNLGAPINHTGHVYTGFSGNYASDFEKRDRTAISLCHACFSAESNELLCAVMSNYPSILSKYNIELENNKYGHIDPNWLMIYFESAKDKTELREFLLEDLRTLLTDTETKFKFVQEPTENVSTSEGYTYDMCALKDEERSQRDDHLALKTIKLSGELTVRITHLSPDGEEEAGEFLMKHGFAPLYRRNGG